IRSFGDDPVRVASMVSRYVSTIQSFGVMAVAKHFPGHGDTSIDSHLDLPSVDVDMNTLLNRELIPFKAAVDSGVSCIMTSHVSFPNIDPSRLPATFSSIILRDILRGMLGFNGVIISDALEMKAISGRFDVRDVASYGLKAGLDIFLRCFDFDYIFDLKDSIIRFVNNGLISRDRIYESFKRIENLRGRFNLPSIMDPIYKVPLENLRRNRYLSHKVSLAAVTVNNGDLLKPLGIFGSLAILIPKNLERFLSNFNPEVVSLFVNEFGADIGTMVVTVYDENISIDDVLDVVLNVDGVLFFTYNAIFNKYQLDLYEKIKDRVSVIVIAGLPYDANFISDKKPIIFTYGLNTISLSALVDVLCGSHIAGGGLPVKLNFSSICGTSPSHMHSL
ncbi:MAG: glycoside hydrolase family 3 N-terminal domain-containing protein, partial [Candidatus Methanomethylicia archaeon]